MVLLLSRRRIAQTSEHPDYTGGVAGSTPAPPTNFLKIPSPSPACKRYR
jgi:hypothetical protein